MTLKVGYNTTHAPVLVDGQGHLIGGQEWGVYDTTEDDAQAELDAGRLVPADLDALANSDNKQAHDALRVLEERQSRLDRAKSLDKEALADALPEETVEALEAGGDGLPSKDELVDAAVADSSVDLDAAADDGDDDKPAPKKTTSRAGAAKK